jgi:predicted ArsR family transcriptional regulator
MDPYEKEIMNALKDGKPRSFHQILDEIGFSHNTLRLHLNSMVDEGLVAREKMPSKGRGRPVSSTAHPSGPLEHLERL